MKIPSLGRFLLMLLLTSAGVLVAGCATAPESVGPGTVETHFWQGLRQTPDKPWTGRRPAMFTYLVTGESVDATAQTPESVGARERLAKLLDAVQGHEPLASNEPDALASANLFLIPTQVLGGSKTDVRTFDYSLGKQYLRYFRAALASNPKVRTSLGDSGPFLLATRRPIGEIVSATPSGPTTVAEGAPILVVNLTGKHPDSVARYVRAFEKAVEEKGISQTEELSSFAAAFVSWVLTLNDDVSVISEAYASAKEVFQ